MKKVAIPLLACTALVGLAATADATSGPGCFRVVNVESWDVLNMRRKPTHRSAIVDKLPPGRHGIISLQGTCIPPSADWSSRWCPVKHYNGDRITRGWVKRRFLADSDCP